MERYFITQEHYRHFVIPLFNSVFRELLRLRNFRQTYYPLHIEYLDSSDETLQISDTCTREAVPSNCASKALFLGYAKPCTDGRFPELVSGYHCHLPTLDLAPLMRMDYRTALQAIVDFELPQREFSATYNGYAILCHHLRLRIPRADDVQRCFTCGRSISQEIEKPTDCRCVEYYFGHVQYLRCSCIMGRVSADFCCCDDVPEILHDLDEVRHIQFSIVQKLLGIFNHSIDFLNLMITLYYMQLFALSIGTLDYSIHMPIWAMGNYKPP